jgi:hypothetical protein
MRNTLLFIVFILSIACSKAYENENGNSFIVETQGNVLSIRQGVLYKKGYPYSGQLNVFNKLGTHNNKPKNNITREYQDGILFNQIEYSKTKQYTKYDEGEFIKMNISQQTQAELHHNIENQTFYSAHKTFGVEW